MVLLLRTFLYQIGVNSWSDYSLTGLSTYLVYTFYLIIFAGHELASSSVCFMFTKSKCTKDIKSLISWFYYLA